MLFKSLESKSESVFLDILTYFFLLFLDFVYYKPQKITKITQKHHIYPTHSYQDLTMLKQRKSQKK